MNNILTIFVSSFNQEDVIFDTLESLIGQKCNKFYKIVVSDDCSTDKSLFLLTEFAKKNSNVEVISPQKNLGIGGNRNFMIQNCDTEYLCFVDGDDMQDEEYVRNIYEAIDNSKKMLYKFRKTKFIYEKSENLINNVDFGTVWSMVFNIEFFKNNVFCTDRIMGADDILFYCSNFNKIVSCNNYIEYHYRHYRLESLDSISRDEIKRYHGFMQLLEKINLIERSNPNIADFVNSFKYQMFILAFENNIRPKNLDIKIKKLHRGEKIMYIFSLLPTYPISRKIIILSRKLR